MSVKQDQNFV